MCTSFRKAGRSDIQFNLALALDGVCPAPLVERGYATFIEMHCFCQIVLQMGKAPPLLLAVGL